MWSCILAVVKAGWTRLQNCIDIQISTILQRGNTTYLFRFMASFRLGLPRPHLISDRSDQLQLLDHIFVVDRVSLGVTAETTLRADTEHLERHFSRNIVALGDIVCRLVHTIHHLLLVLRRTVLGRDNSQYHILAQRQMLERLKTTGTFSVVFEVKGIRVEIGEQLSCDPVVRALTEMSATDVVSSAKVNTEVHVVGALAG